MVERHLARLTWTDIAALDKDEGVVILPVGVSTVTEGMSRAMPTFNSSA